METEGLISLDPSCPPVRIRAKGGPSRPPAIEAQGHLVLLAHVLVRKSGSHHPQPRGLAHEAWPLVLWMPLCSVMEGWPGEACHWRDFVMRPQSASLTQPLLSCTARARHSNFQGHFLSLFTFFQTDVTNGVLMTTVLVQQIKAESVAERPALHP